MQCEKILEPWLETAKPRIIFSEEIKNISSLKALKAHSHPFWELKLFDNHIIITPPNVIHVQIAPGDHTLQMVIWVERSSIQFDRRKNFSFAGVEDFIVLTALPPQALLENMYRHRGKDKYRQLNHANFRLLLCALMLMNKKDHLESSMSIAEQVRNYIKRYYYLPELCVRSIAQEFKVSASYLASIMKKSGAPSVSSMLISVRLENSMQLLQTGRYSVKEVAAASGWNNEFYFSNVFKRHYTLRPSQVKVKAPAEYTGTNRLS